MEDYLQNKTYRLRNKSKVEYGVYETGPIAEEKIVQNTNMAKHLKRNSTANQASTKVSAKSSRFVPPWYSVTQDSLYVKFVCKILISYEIASMNILASMLRPFKQIPV